MERLTNTKSSAHQDPRVSRKHGVAETDSSPHTPEQELTHFGSWASEPIWVPPSDSSSEIAKSMLNRFGLFASKAECWQAMIREHREKFTQVRKLELPRASIRLPEGQVFVTVTERERFHEIEDPIPPSVQTRLEEFLAGRGKQRGVKVYYLKPLCVEIGNELVFTTEAELREAIEKIQAEVFAAFRRHYLPHRARRLVVSLLDASLAIPRSTFKFFIERKKREIAAYHSKLEFVRRQRALEALRCRQHYHADDCTFEDILSLTPTLERSDVIDHYVEEKSLAHRDKKMFLLASGETLPWFLALSIVAYKLATISLTTASVAVVDPVFVAEMPNSKGQLLKIGHFDEVDGIMHVEI